MTSLDCTFDLSPNSFAECTKLGFVRVTLHNPVICVYDKTGNVIETHEHTGVLKVWAAEQNKEPPR